MYVERKYKIDSYAYHAKVRNWREISCLVLYADCFNLYISLCGDTPIILKGNSWGLVASLDDGQVRSL